MSKGKKIPSSYLEKDIGEAFKDLLNHSKLSTKSVASKSGIPKKRIDQIMQGSGTTVSTLERLAGAFGYKIEIGFKSDSEIMEHTKSKIKRTKTNKPVKAEIDDDPFRIELPE